MDGGFELSRQYGVRRVVDPLVSGHPVPGAGCFSPTCAFRRPDGTTVVGDPFNARVLIASPDGEVVSITNPARDSWFPRWVAPLPDGRLAYADRNHSEVGIIDPDGHIRGFHLDLDVPMFIAPTDGQGYLVAGRGNTPIMELDEHFTVIRTYLDASYNIHSAQKLGDDRLLICDVDRHQVLIINPGGDVEWAYGKALHPGEQFGELSTPKYAWLDHGLVHVADGMNSRVLAVDLQRNVRRCYGQAPGQHLWFPHSVQDLGGGHVLIADGCNSQVIEVGLDGETVWRMGHPQAGGFDLRSPRVIDDLPDGGFLVADAYNHRIVRFDQDFKPTWQYSGHRGSGEAELFWPRCARYAGSDTYLIADSRNARILLVDGNGRTLKDLRHYTLDGRCHRLQDPHDLDLDEKGALLVTDSSLNLVLHMYWSGRVIWVYGLSGELRDPHEARFIPGGGCIICDTGHHRIIEVDSSGSVTWELRGSSLGRFSNPRWCDRQSDDSYVVTDTGHNRIVCVDRQGQALWSFGERWALDDQSLRAPRFARLLGKRLLVSDSFNNRIVELSWVDRLPRDRTPPDHEGDPARPGTPQ